MNKLLTHGKILKGDECPFRNKCRIAKECLCNHKGIFHSRDFSCSTARFFDMTLVQVKKGAIGGKTRFPRPSFEGRVGFISRVEEDCVWIRVDDQELIVTKDSVKKFGE